MVRTLIAFTLAALVIVSPASGAQVKAAAQTAAKPPVTGTININTASATDLQRLPGIGAKTAGRVVEYRQKNGPFKKVEELMNVPGVGEKSFLKLKSQISIGTSKPEAPAAPQ